MKDIHKIYWWYIGAIIATVVSIIIITVQQIDIPQDKQWSNNATLIVEVGVGIVVTLVVLMITKVSEKKMDKKIRRIKRSVENDRLNNLYQEMEILDFVLKELIPLEILIGNVITQIDSANKADYSLRENFTENITKYVNLCQLHAKKITNSEYLNIQFFVSEEIEELKKIAKLLSRMPNINEYQWNPKDYSMALSKTSDRIRFFTNRREDARKELSKILK